MYFPGSKYWYIQSNLIEVASPGPSGLMRNRNSWHVIVNINNPDSKVHGTNMGPSWGRQDPGGPHVGHMNLAIWEIMTVTTGSTSSWLSTLILPGPMLTFYTPELFLFTQTADHVINAHDPTDHVIHLHEPRDHVIHGHDPLIMWSTWPYECVALIPLIQPVSCLLHCHQHPPPPPPPPSI